MAFFSYIQLLDAIISQLEFFSYFEIFIQRPFIVLCNPQFCCHLDIENVFSLRSCAFKKIFWRQQVTLGKLISEFYSV